MQFYEDVFIFLIKSKRTQILISFQIKAVAIGHIHLNVFGEGVGKDNTTTLTQNRVPQVYSV